MGEKLTRRDQTIINYKANGGNMKKAMIDAGYSETYADKNSKYLLGIIGQQIQEEQASIKSEGIKTIEEVQQWWSQMIDNNKVENRDKIRCSELLVKSRGGFIDKMEIGTKSKNPFDDLTADELRQLIDDD